MNINLEKQRCCLSTDCIGETGTEAKLHLLTTTALMTSLSFATLNGSAVVQNADGEQGVSFY